MSLLKSFLSEPHQLSRTTLFVAPTQEESAETQTSEVAERPDRVASRSPAGRGKTLPFEAQSSMYGERIPRRFPSHCILSTRAARPSTGSAPEDWRWRPLAHPTLSAQRYWTSARRSARGWLGGGDRPPSAALQPLKTSSGLTRHYDCLTNITGRSLF